MMTGEVRYIIENKKFKQTWSDYLVYWEFVVPALMVVAGINFIFNGETILDYSIGIILILVSFPLVYFLRIRIRHLTGFEELINAGTDEENFNLCIQRLKNLNIVKVEADFHNLTINAKFRSIFIPPFYEWLTIVCLNKRILINSRPEPTFVLLWLRRNAVLELIKIL